MKSRQAQVGGRNDGDKHHWEQGNASLEFLGVTLILLVPLVYLVIALSQVQAAAFAAQSAAHDVSRVLVQISDREQATTAAHYVVYQSFADHGLSIDPGQALSIDCAVAECESGFATIRIHTTIPLPGVPQIIADRTFLEVDVSAEVVTDIGMLRVISDG